MARKKKVKTKTKKIDASNPQSDQGEQYHLKVKPGDLADIVLMPGDPKRVQKIAKEWETANKVAEYRQYVSYTGLYKGVPISSVSSGIGPPACEIAMLELKNVKVGNLIRVGSCGTLQKEIELGELIISEAAVRLEDTSKHYVINEYPAVASRMVTSALIRACEENNLPYHVGITASASSFYAGQGREVHNYLPSHQSKIVDDLTKAGVLNFEMEASVLFVLGSIFKFEVGAICAVYANRVTNEFEVKGEDRVIKAANEGARILADYLADRGNKRSWY